MTKEFLIVFLGEYLGYVLLGILLIFFLRNSKERLLLLLQVAAAAFLSRSVITEAIRFFWHRSRPFVENGTDPLIDHVPAASFPSGHAAVFFAIAAIVYARNRKLGTLFFAGAVAIGIGRVLAGIHWPSDIVGGAIVGIVSGFLVVQLSKRVAR